MTAVPKEQPPKPEDFTVEIWDGESEDAAQVDQSARVVDVVRVEDRWHLVVVSDAV